MDVYIELVLFNNFFMDLLLEVCTLTARRRSISRFRCALGAMFGACAATVYAVLPMPWRAVLAAATAPVECLIFFKPKKGRFVAKAADYIATLLVFAAFTFLAGGAAMGLSYLLGRDINGYIGLGLAAFGLTVCICAARAVAFRASAKKRDALSVTLCAAGRQISCKALCDSGNLLTDPLTGLPVVIISGDIADAMGDLRREGFIDVKTVGGQSDLPLIMLDGVEVDGKRMPALGAISNFGLGGYDVILQASMF